jgi:hypothetical protein
MCESVAVAFRRIVYEGFSSSGHGGLEPTRNFIAFLVLIMICGCSNRLEPLARGLKAAWKLEQRQSKLVLRPENKDGHTILHCVLSDVSWQAIARISGPPRPISIAPGQSAEGEIELTAMRVGDLPRNKDLLLLWSYWIGDGHSDKGIELSGIVLLKTT